MNNYHCPNCGNTVPDGGNNDEFIVCQYCGSKIPIHGQSSLHTEKHIYEDKAKLLKIEKDAELKAREKDFEERRYIDSRNDEIENRIERRVLLTGRKLLTALLIVVVLVIALFSFVGSKISHRNDIRIPSSEFEYIGQDYSVVQQRLTDAGFESIATKEFPDLSMADAAKVGTVSSVSADGKTGLKKDAWVHKKANIVINYHTIDPERLNDIQVPDSYSSLVENEIDYLTLLKRFHDAGFSKVDMITDSRINVFQRIGNKNGIVEDIAINGKKDFNEGDYFPADSVITLTVLTTKEEAEKINNMKNDMTALLANSIAIPYKASYYAGQKYIDVERQMKSLGFTNVVTIPSQDYSKTNDKNIDLVAEISIDGYTEFKAKDIFALDAVVEIRYYTYGDNIKLAESVSSYKDKYYYDVEKQLSGEGFTDITLEPLGDIISSSDKKNINKVSEVSIDGNTSIKKGTLVPATAKIVIRYHTLDPDLNDKVEVSNKASYYSGKDYAAVADELKNQGFTNIKYKELKDLDSSAHKNLGKVSSVSIDGKIDFPKGEFFFANSEIIISYHSVSDEALAKEKAEAEAREGKIILEHSSTHYKTMKYEKAVEELKAFGFTNVRAVGLKNLNKFTSALSGVVADISIDGKEDFKKGDYYDPTVEIIVYYNSVGD